MEKNKLSSEEEKLLRLLIQNNESALEQIFIIYHEQLFHFICKYVRISEVAEEITQDVFIGLWKKRKELNIHTSLKAYLYTMAKNRSIDYIRKHFQEKYQTRDLELVHIADNATEDQYQSRELESIIAKGIAELPEKCRIIFGLSRNAGLSYKEIAEALKISVKTVEAQMGIALKRLKAYVSKHWLSMWVLLLYLIKELPL